MGRITLHFEQVSFESLEIEGFESRERFSLHFRQVQWFRCFKGRFKDRA